MKGFLVVSGGSGLGLDSGVAASFGADTGSGAGGRVGKFSPVSCWMRFQRPSSSSARELGVREA